MCVCVRVFVCVCEGGEGGGERRGEEMGRGKTRCPQRELELQRVVSFQYAGY